MLRSTELRGPDLGPTLTLPDAPNEPRPTGVGFVRLPPPMPSVDEATVGFCTVTTAATDDALVAPASAPTTTTATTPMAMALPKASVYFPKEKAFSVYEPRMIKAHRAVSIPSAAPPTVGIVTPQDSVPIPPANSSPVARPVSPQPPQQPACVPPPPAPVNPQLGVRYSFGSRLRPMSPHMQAKVAARATPSPSVLLQQLMTRSANVLPVPLEDENCVARGTSNLQEVALNEKDSGPAHGKSNLKLSLSHFISPDSITSLLRKASLVPQMSRLSASPSPGLPTSPKAPATQSQLSQEQSELPQVGRPVIPSIPPPLPSSDEPVIAIRMPAPVPPPLQAPSSNPVFPSCSVDSHYGTTLKLGAPILPKALPMASTCDGGLSGTRPPAGPQMAQSSIAVPFLPSPLSLPQSIPSLHAPPSQSHYAEGSQLLPLPNTLPLAPPVLHLPDLSSTQATQAPNSPTSQDTGTLSPSPLMAIPVSTVNALSLPIPSANENPLKRTNASGYSDGKSLSSRVLGGPITVPCLPQAVPSLESEASKIPGSLQQNQTRAEALPLPTPLSQLLHLPQPSDLSPLRQEAEVAPLPKPTPLPESLSQQTVEHTTAPPAPLFQPASAYATSRPLSEAVTTNDPIQQAPPAIRSHLPLKIPPATNSQTPDLPSAAPPIVPPLKLNNHKASPVTAHFPKDKSLLLCRALQKTASTTANALPNKQLLYMSSPRSASARTITSPFRVCIRSSLSGNVDWNTEYQAILDLPDSEVKFRKLFNLEHDFVYASIAYAKIIISELCMPREVKTIKPISVGGVAGGQKYLCQNILFKVLVDTLLPSKVYLYGGSSPDQQSAMKSGSHDLKGMMAWNSAGIEGIRFPLMAVIGFKGFRVIALSVLPVNKEQTLKYGTADGGEIIHNDDTILSRKMANAAAEINLAPHYVGNDDAGTTLCGPADLEGHSGLDGKYYLLDFSRTFPPEWPNRSPQAIFYELVRPELVRKWPVPLSSDAFSRFEMSDQKAEDHQIELTKLSAHLHGVVIPQFAQELDKIDCVNENNGASESIDKYFAKMRSNQIEATFNELRLVERMHRQGINLRHLGMVYKASESPLIRLCLAVEMVARILRRFIQEAHACTMDSTMSLRDEYFKESIVLILQKLIGSKFDPDFWQSVKKAITKKFCGGDESLLMTLPFSSIPLSLLCTRLEQIGGFKFNSIALESLRHAHKSFEFVDSDIESVIPMVKHTNVIDSAEAMSLFMAGKSKVFTPSPSGYDLFPQKGMARERLLNLSFQKFEQALLRQPNNYRNYYQWGCALLLQSVETKTLATKRIILRNACQKFRSAMSINPNFVDGLLGLAEGLWELSITYTPTKGQSKAPTGVLSSESVDQSVTPNSTVESSSSAPSTPQGNPTLNSNSESDFKAAVEIFETLIRTKPSTHKFCAAFIQNQFLGAELSHLGLLSLTSICSTLKVNIVPMPPSSCHVIGKSNTSTGVLPLQSTECTHRPQFHCIEESGGVTNNSFHSTIASSVKSLQTQVLFIHFQLQLMLTLQSTDLESLLVAPPPVSVALQDLLVLDQSYAQYICRTAECLISQRRIMTYATCFWIFSIVKQILPLPPIFCKLVTALQNCALNLQLQRRQCADFYAEAGNRLLELHQLDPAAATDYIKTLFRSEARENKLILPLMCTNNDQVSRLCQPFFDEVTDCYLSHTSADDSTLLALSMTARQLKCLSLSQCQKVTDASLPFLLNFTVLGTLNLTNCSRLSFTNFSQFPPSLIELRLAGCYIEDATIEAIAKSCTKLEILDLCRCPKITSVAALQSLQALHTLLLQGCSSVPTQSINLLVLSRLSPSASELLTASTKSPHGDIIQKNTSSPSSPPPSTEGAISAAILPSSCCPLKCLSVGGYSVKENLRSGDMSYIVKMLPLIPSLTELSCTECTLDDQGLTDICKYLPMLRSLNINKSLKISSAFQHITLLTQLESLELSATKVTAEHLEAFSRHLLRLTHFDISHSQIPYSGFKSFLSGAPELLSFRASHSKPMRLYPLDNHIKLQELDVGRSTLTNSAVAEIAIKLTNLTSLSIANLNNVDSQTVKLLGNLTHLRKLNLSSCSAVSDSNFAPLLPHMTELRVLDLSYTHIGDQTVFNIIKYLLHLEELDVTTTQITEQAAIELHHLQAHSKVCCDQNPDLLFSKTSHRIITASMPVAKLLKHPPLPRTQPQLPTSTTPLVLVPVYPPPPTKVDDNNTH
ncbi:Histidine kinase A [Pelomyxa schiedti]|nr:Histidine kinase A [Pelomyxa schiedti]